MSILLGNKIIMALLCGLYVSSNFAGNICVKSASEERGFYLNPTDSYITSSKFPDKNAKLDNSFNHPGNKNTEKFSTTNSCVFIQSLNKQNKTIEERVYISNLIKHLKNYKFPPVPKEKKSKTKTDC